MKQLKKYLVLLTLCMVLLLGMAVSTSAVTTTVLNDTGDGTGNWYMRDNTAGTDSFGNASPGADNTGKCLKLVNPNGRVLLLARNSAAITYKKGYTYTITWKMKSQDANETVYLAFFNNVLQTTPAVISHGQVGGTTGKYSVTNSWSNYSTTFTVNSLSNGGTSTNNALMFRISSGGTLFIDDVVITETPCYTVSVTAGENGSVLKDGAAVGSAFYVTEGNTVTLDLVPQVNYEAKVTVNGTDYAVNNNQVTLTVTENTAVAVSFEQIPDVTPGIASDASYSWFKNEGEVPTIFSYHKLNGFNTGESDLEYGVNLWNTEYPDDKVALAAYEADSEEPTKAKAVPGAQFAIKAYGKAIQSNQTYTVQPYIGDTTGSESTLTFE